MSICKIGVMGVGRGSILWKCSNKKRAKVVAICDKWADGLKAAKREIDDESVAFYSDFDEFLKHDMDVVVLANYATEHAPFAIKAMKAGKNVISEVLPAQTLAQAVELIECVESTGMKYCYAENYCYMLGAYEIKKKYEAGELGEFEYGEGEYMHNCEPIWPEITYGDKDHWRNNMSAFFYCTHSAGPLLHITGMRPVKVTGFELPFNPRMARMGAKAGSAAIEMVQLENGAYFKSIHGVGPSKNSVWYSVYGSKGRCETAREDAEMDDNARIYVNLDTVEGISENNVKTYIPDFGKVGPAAMHGGSDDICLDNAYEFILGEKADVIDVYEAVDMWLIGFFGYLSVLEGGIPKDIPDLRKKEVRDIYRNDNRCTDPNVAGDMLLPSYSKGNPQIDDSIYEQCRKKFEKTLEEKKQQLIMHWENDGEPYSMPEMPDGITVATFPQVENAMEEWLDIVQYGLSEKREDEKFYKILMTDWENYSEDKCFFLLSNGKPIATITVICDYEKQHGYIHMVGLKPECRGKGLGNLLNSLGVAILKREGMKTAHLTTDDWRIPAIKSYLRFGFKPDKSTDIFERRWSVVMAMIEK